MHLKVGKYMNIKRKIWILLAVLILSVFSILTVTGCEKSDNEKTLKNIQIMVYDGGNTMIYDEKKQTEEDMLIDVLKSLDDLDVETENGDYGEYILSIDGHKQGDNYYWNYYVNDAYATVGVSSCKVKENDVYTFKLEKFE